MGGGLVIGRPGIGVRALGRRSEGEGRGEGGFILQKLFFEEGSEPGPKDRDYPFSTGGGSVTMRQNCLPIVPCRVRPDKGPTH